MSPKPVMHRTASWRVAAARSGSMAGTLRPLSRVAVLTAAAGLMAGFVATRRVVPAPPSSTAIPGPGASGVVAARTAAREIPKLHDRPPSVALLPSPGRNLFAFRAPARAPASARTHASVPAPLAEATVTAARDGPSWTLIGIAEDPGADGPVRTAIISSGDRLMLVKEGDVIAPQYRVGLIAADSAELLDSGNGGRRRLAFK